MKLKNKPQIGKNNKYMLNKDMRSTYYLTTNIYECKSNSTRKKNKTWRLIRCPITKKNPSQIIIVDLFSIAKIKI